MELEIGFNVYSEQTVIAHVCCVTGSDLGQLFCLDKNVEFGLVKGRKEGNVLFNDALNTFYLRLYDV